MRFQLCQTYCWAVPSYHVAHNTKCCMWYALRVLHMIAPGHLSVRVGDGSQHSEEIAQILNCAFERDYYYYYYYYYYIIIKYVCVPFSQGMQLHRQAAEERLANNNMGQSFLARQRQVHSRRAQTINTLHTGTPNRWSCPFAIARPPPSAPGRPAVQYTLHSCLVDLCPSTVTLTSCVCVCVCVLRLLDTWCHSQYSSLFLPCLIFFLFIWFLKFSLNLLNFAVQVCGNGRVERLGCSKFLKIT